MAQRIFFRQGQWLSVKANNLTKNLMRFSTCSELPRFRRPSPFAVLHNVAISKNESFKEASNRMQADVDKYQRAMDICQKGGGEKATARHLKQKKLLAAERLSLMLDEDSDFMELSPLAGLGMEYGDVPKAGLITGTGRVNGVLCMFIVNDATVKGGTVYPITLKKQLRAQEIAEQNRLPCVYAVDSGGAYLPLQAEIFPDKNQGGRVFYNEAVFSSMGIPQVAIVCGSCTAGAAYIPTLADEAIIINKIGRIFLGGPPLVKAATGEVVTADDLGGAVLHSTISGCTDHYTDTEQEAFTLCRDVVASFNIPDTPVPQEWDVPLYDPKELIGLVPENIEDYDVHRILARMVDGSRFHEFKVRYGPSLVTGFCHIEGHLVGVLGNKGEVTGEGALKGAHFVQLCSERHIPLVFLQNSAVTPPNDDTSGEALGETMKSHAKMLYAVSVAEVPKLTVILGGSHGINNYLMAGRAMSPNFVFLWPSARISAAGVCGGMEVTDEAKRSVTEAEEMSALYSSSRLWDDGVLLPQHTRKVLGQCLRIVSQNSQLPKRGAGVIRM